MIKKRKKTVEVLVVMTPEQVISLFELHPEEMSFTRRLITWDLRGRKRVDMRARRLEVDKDTVRVIPEDDVVPAFKLVVK